MMKKNINKTDNDTNKINKIMKYRKWIILSTFLVIVVFGIVGGYVSTYFAKKVTPFSTLSYEETSVKKIDAFNFDFYCSEYNEPDDLSPSTTMKFTAVVSDAKENFTITSITYRVALGNRNWTKRYIESSSSTIASTFTSSSGTRTREISISNYTYNYPCRTMLFIKTETPDAFVFLQWTEKKDGTSTTTTYSKCLTYSYDGYYRKGTTIIG